MLNGFKATELITIEIASFDHSQSLGRGARLNIQKLSQ